VIRGCVDRVRTLHGVTAEALQYEPCGPASVMCDVEDVRAAVTNLIDNAVRHNTAGGWIRIVTESADDRGVIHVANSGPVIPPAELETLFQPFRQLGGRRTRQGHGLGLAIVRAIATSHGASITARPQPVGGLDIEVDFPAAGTKRRCPKIEEGGPLPKGTALLLDDRPQDP
jgi:signal transduction histidine kinase